jgi:hypothetical protein
MADSNQALLTIDGWIRDLQKTSAAVAKMPQQLVPIVHREVNQSIASATSLDGDKWDPTVKDEKQALVGTEKYVDVYASGSVIWIRLRGPLALSQFGNHRQKARRVLPRGGIPAKLGNAIRFGIVDAGVPFLTRKGSHRKGANGIKWDLGSSGGKSK